MGSAHELAKLGAHAGKETQTVVLGQGGQEVLDRLAGNARALGELGDDGALVGDGERGDREDGDQLRILLQQGVEGSDTLGGRLEGGGLDGGRVLFRKQNDAG